MKWKFALTVDTSSIQVNPPPQLWIRQQTAKGPSNPARLRISRKRQCRGMTRKKSPSKLRSGSWNSSWLRPNSRWSSPSVRSRWDQTYSTQTNLGNQSTKYQVNDDMTGESCIANMYLSPGFLSKRCVIQTTCPTLTLSGGSGELFFLIQPIPVKYPL